MHMLGVDIGGSGIKGCLVDTKTGELIGERHRIATPQPATPAAIAHTLKALVEHFDWKGPVGCGFPATIHNGVAKSAANIDKSWIETDAEHLFADVTGKPCYVLNDADAAGLAEMRFGAGKDRKGVIILITVGTGIGTAIFVNGHLLPNTELGHLMLEGMVAEHYCSDAARKREDLSWNRWGKRFNKYLARLEFLFSPDLFILGGGSAAKLYKFVDRIETRAPLIPAASLNQAGIIGAALYAAEQQG
ncbi:ROK family protein [Aeromonas veronii]|uniref:polyphosphate--glucose phosphotransferase n=1 Tax=Aeromonas veronii TaxID=654 RepID=UPI0013246B73|nr:ROK family protein [Aeromonas veronii]MCR3967302.1 ROK family protein [Aeromonas veronii]MCR3979747.1 ROK family protein [Aeromonas veronii]MXV28885.1 ROK family protein [Aeromonas veronii]